MKKHCRKLVQKIKYKKIAVYRTQPEGLYKRICRDTDHTSASLPAVWTRNQNSDIHQTDSGRRQEASSTIDHSKLATLYIFVVFLLKEQRKTL
jgi:hypothetical protein